MSELVEVGTPMPGRASPGEPGPVSQWWMGPGDEDDDEEAPIGDPDDDEGYGEDDEDDEDEEPLQL